MKLTDITTNKQSYVGLLTLSQKNELTGQIYATDSYFYPIQDLNDNWVISIEEMEYCTNPSFSWVSNLDVIIFEPKPDVLP